MKVYSCTIILETYEYKHVFVYGKDEEQVKSKINYVHETYQKSNPKIKHLVLAEVFDGCECQCKKYVDTHKSDKNFYQPFDGK